jgi:hypothetical protein
MKTRLRCTLRGLCLVALQAGGLLALHMNGAQAQTVTVAMERAPGDNPVLIDEAWKAPGNIPEIIRPTDAYGDMLGSKATRDPNAVLTPPSVDPRIFASYRNR